MTDRLKLSDPRGSGIPDERSRRLVAEGEAARVSELERNIAELEALLGKQQGAKYAIGAGGTARIGARKNSVFKAVSAAPSINKTPRGPTMVPVAYTTVQDLANSAGLACTVRFNGDAVYVLDQSTQPRCTGDERGTGGGVKSGTVNGLVRPIESSGNVRVEGKLVVRQGDRCTMNNGNNLGVYVTAQAPAAHSPKNAATTSNPPIELETEEEVTWFTQWLADVKDDLAAAAEDPVNAASGAIKDLINLVPELTEALGQAVIEQRAQELLEAAAVADQFGNTQQGESLRRVSASIRTTVAPKVILPKLALTSKAEQGGAHVSTLIQIAAGGLGLCKSTMKLIRGASVPPAKVPVVLAETAKANSSTDGVKVLARTKGKGQITPSEMEEWLRREHGISSREKLDDMIASMDQSKPVSLVELPQGTEVVQYVREGGQVGTFFAYPGTTPAELAISGEGRVLSRFVLSQPVTVLEGSAARFPIGKYPGVGGPGGGTQLIFPKNVRIPKG